MATGAYVGQLVIAFDGYRSLSFITLDAILIYYVDEVFTSVKQNIFLNTPASNELRYNTASLKICAHSLEKHKNYDNLKRWQKKHIISRILDDFKKPLLSITIYFVAREDQNQK